ncbi:MAG: ABC transporter ATP-binding protein, partial [Clostridia bacterium]|nr:ABC transporter ATP-binding protein [Clostridia bacterium]
MSQQKNDKQVKLRFFGINRILPFMKPFKRMMVFMAGLGLFTSLVDVAITLFQRYALNNFVEKNTFGGKLSLFIAVYLAAIIAQSLATYYSCSRAMTVEVSLNRDLRQAAFTHLQTLSFSYFNQNSVGYIHARVLSDTSRIGSLASWTVMDGVWHTSYLVFAAGVMLA